MEMNREEEQVLTQIDVLLEEEAHFDESGFDRKRINRASELIKHRHSEGNERTALCLSGGGIRSATFSLGVLQGLARAGLLKQIDYLSTVSGGGFIGSWLSRWVNEEADNGGLDKVESELAKSAPEPDAIKNLRAHSSYLSPKRGLSRDSATLAAIVIRNMMLTWLVIVPIIVAALLLPALMVALLHESNQFLSLLTGTLILVSFLALWFGVFHFLGGSNQVTEKPALLGLFPWLVAAVLSVCWRPAWDAFVFLGVVQSKSASNAHYMELGIFTVLAIPSFLALVFVLNGLFQGVLSQWLPERLRERSSRNSSILIRYSVLWVILSSVVLIVPLLFLDALRYAPTWVSGVGGVAGLAAVVAGYFGRSGNTQPSNIKGSWRGWLNRNILPVLASLLLVIMASAISVVISEVLYSNTPIASAEGSKVGGNSGSERTLSERLFLNHSQQSVVGEGPNVKNLSRADFWNNQLIEVDREYRKKHLASESAFIASAIFASVFMSFVTSWLFGVNRFSLHAMYGNRLVRSYLAAARKKRAPDLETGFDANDNIAFSLMKSNRPFHVINAALNLGASERTEWLQRKAASFTFSSLHSGSEPTQYVRSHSYTSSENGISLGKAMTISGAAVSPAMGYHSSKIVGALLTLLNARLGWWLPNPRQRGETHLRRSEPRFGFFQLLTEFLGSTNDKSSFVHLSDGGHFDNLGLYEMVRRRCRCIVVVDAGQDSNNDYENLCNAIRMIRVDFGIDVVFDPNEGPGHGNKMTKHYAVGRIGYAQADQSLSDEYHNDGHQADQNCEISDGVIIYIKPVLTGDEPIDLFHYAEKKRERAKFPHETTADQFFDESQFESYRKLGLISGEDVVSKCIKGNRLTAITAPPIDRTRVVRLEESKSVSDTTSKEELEPSSDALETASKVSQIFGQASSWVAPAVVSTIAAASVVTINHKFVNPEEGIQLKLPEQAISIENPQLQLPNGCEVKDGKLYCGALDINIGQLGLSPEAVELKQQGVSLNLELPEVLEKATDELQGIRVNTNDANLVSRALGGQESGIVLTKSARTELSSATTKLDGVRINENDLAALQTAVKDIQPITGSLDRMAKSIVGVAATINGLTEVNKNMTKIDGRLKKIDDRISGLRNDSGGN